MAKLYFNYGAMGCGKTREIMKVYHNYIDNEKYPLIMKASKDTRGGNKIVSRDGSELSVDFSICKEDNIFLLVSNYLIDNNLDVIIVDEAQFLEEHHVEELALITEKFDITVMCYGLKSDFQDKLFPGSAALFAKANEIEKMKTICKCGDGAEHNVRFIDGLPVFEGDQVAINGEGKTTYQSMCGKCRRRLYNEWKGRNKK